MENTTVFASYEEAAAAAAKMGFDYTVEADFCTKTFTVAIRPSRYRQSYEAYESSGTGIFGNEDAISVVGG